MTLNKLAFGIRMLKIVAISITRLSMMSNIKHWNTQYNEKQQNDTEHNCTLDKNEHNGIKQIGIQHKDAQDNCTEHNRSQNESDNKH